MKSTVKKAAPGRGSSRRLILQWASTTAAAAAAFGVDVPGLRLPQAFAQSGVDLGAGDVGVLNYAYALEQLEAAFYTQVIASPYAGMSRGEHALLRDIRDHEIAHRSFLAKALGRNRIPNLTPNFSAVNFGDRSSVLTTASTFEDLGVAAYNGGGAAIQNPAYLAVAGSIVSVEARHAETLRNLSGTPGSGQRARPRSSATAIAGSAASGSVHRNAGHGIAASLIRFGASISCRTLPFSKRSIPTCRIA